MDTSSIELPGSEIESVTLESGVLTIHFSRAYLVKTMTGSAERTRWWQAGDLIFEDAEVEGELPTGPLVAVGGDVADNVYTYRDMIPVPLQSQGRVGCNLNFEGSDAALVARGGRVKLAMIGVPKYIEHIRR